jgi:GMP reductase
MHRFLDNNLFIKTAQENNFYVSISVGVKQEDKNLITLIKGMGIEIEYITIDVAHGHSEQVIEMIDIIKNNLPDVFLIAGNIATAEAAIDLKLAGADAVKVGIGQGSACITKDKTGFTVPMFTCVRDIYEEKIGIPIIADGGVRSNGDIAKAIVAGADMVMCGSLFAECVDSPSDIFEDSDGHKYKLYYGSASEHNKINKIHIEGTLKKVPQTTMTYLQKMEEIRQDLSSAISYSGGNNLRSLKGSIKFYATK